MMFYLNIWALHDDTRTTSHVDHLAVVFPDIFPFWFRGIGRLAWPTFAFLLAEGFRHTKSREKFVMRLLVFALISEIPYDIAMGNNISFISNTNIFYTLFLGGMAICWYERMRKWYVRGISSCTPRVRYLLLLKMAYPSLL